MGSAAISPAGSRTSPEICITLSDICPRPVERVTDAPLNESGLTHRELGLCALARGDEREARRLLLAAIDSYRASSNALQVGLTYKALGDIEADAGDTVASSTLYREGLEATTAAAV